jgi:hypothetical protein
LYYGDPVKFTTTGTLITSGLAYKQGTTVETGGTLGIFLGCEYTPGSTTTIQGTGPLYGKNRYQYWAASTTAIDAVAYVCDDYDVIMKAAVVANGSTQVLTLNAYANPLMIGTNFSSFSTSVQNTGVAGNLSGNSNVAVCAGSSSARVTTATPFRCVGLVQETVVALSASGTSSSANPAVITLAGANSLILPGMIVTGPGITNTTTFVASVSGTTVTLNTTVNAAQSTAVNFNFVGYPEVLLKWNFGYHAYQVAAAI